MTLFLIGVKALLSLNLVFSGESLGASSRVQADLENALVHILPMDSFLVQANVEMSTISERKVIEAESISELKQIRNQPVALPGFRPPPTLERPPGQVKQVYKTVEREVLKGVSVQVTLDQALSSEQIADARSVVRKYLATAFGSKSASSFMVLKMIHQKKEGSDLSGWYQRIGVICLLSFLGLAALLMLIKAFRRPLRESKSKKIKEPAKQATSNPSVCASFVRPTEFLEKILEDPSCFRSFFQRLSHEKQSELRSALAGPAFESLLECLKLNDSKADKEMPMSHSPDSLNHFLILFEDFTRTYKWQNGRFFGFLQSLSVEQLACLIRRENRIAGAVMLRELDSGKSALVLQRLPVNERLQVLSQTVQIAELSPNELAAIERLVRTSVENQPPIEADVAEDREFKFWSEILNRSDNPELLAQIRTQQPELALKLEQNIFNLETAIKMPQAQLEAALGRLDNEQLALALQDCNESLKQHLLSSLSEARRGLVVEQLVAFKSSSIERRELARQIVTQCFREEWQCSPNLSA